MKSCALCRRELRSSPWSLSCRSLPKRSGDLVSARRDVLDLWYVHRSHQSGTGNVSCQLPNIFLMYSHFYPFQHIVFIIWAVFKTLVGWSLLGLSWYHPWRSWRSWIPVLIQKSSAVPRVLSWMGHGGNSAGTWKKDPHENWAVFESPVDD